MRSWTIKSQEFHSSARIDSTKNKLSNQKIAEDKQRNTENTILQSTTPDESTNKCYGNKKVKTIPNKAGNFHERKTFAQKWTQ